MTAIIEVKHLRKTFKDLVAVDDISFDVIEGQCFGLLGPNGAGKSTTIEMLEGILPADAGEIRFRGKPLGIDSMNQIGIQFQNTMICLLVDISGLFTYKKQVFTVILAVRIDTGSN